MNNVLQAITVTFDESVEDQQRTAAVAFVERLKVNAELTVTKKGERDGDKRLER